MTELKTCPFCGGNASYDFFKERDLHFIICDDCCIQTPNQKSKKQAVKIWNKRNKKDQ